MNIAVILAGGTGTRFGSELPKQFLKLANKTIIEFSIDIFLSISQIQKLIIVSHSKYLIKIENLIKTKGVDIDIVLGGSTRQESVFNAIDFVSKNYPTTQNILIHDSARPLITQQDILNLLTALKKYKACSLALPSTDTIVEVDKNTSQVINVPQRDKLWRIQTPQCFYFNTLQQAHILARNDNFTATDDIGLVIHYNLAKAKLIKSSTINMKLTQAEDINILKLYL